VGVLPLGYSHGGYYISRIVGGVALYLEQNRRLTYKNRSEYHSSRPLSSGKCWWWDARAMVPNPLKPLAKIVVDPCLDLGYTALMLDGSSGGKT